MSTKTKVYLMWLVSFLMGCAPGPPLPPVFPGFEWLTIGLVIWLGIFLWKKYMSTEPLKSHNITEILNAIHQQLNALERRIEHLEKRQQQNRKKGHLQ